MVSIFSKFCGSPKHRKIKLLHKHYQKPTKTLPRRVFVATSLLGAFDIVYMINQLEAPEKLD